MQYNKQKNQAIRTRVFGVDEITKTTKLINKKQNLRTYVWEANEITKTTTAILYNKQKIKL